MIVVASSNGRVGIAEAIRLLKEGKSAIDAVEAAIRLVEANPEDRSVGYNGYPNILGQAELDASIMNGRTLESGAVAALTNYAYPISVARKVMETLPHVLLAGEGANRFTAEMGFDITEPLLSDEMEGIRERILTRFMEKETYEQLDQSDELSRWAALATDPERTYGTVNFIAQDGNGDICCGVSTSGWAWKYPGRVGDSPIVGAGNYADNRFGAAACTGAGEMAIRASTAHSVVFYMKMGLSLSEACERAMVDLRDLGGNFVAVMNLVALDPNGNHAGFTSMAGRTYIFQTDEMEAYEERPRTVVELPFRWGK